MAVNPVNTVSALKTVLSRFVALPERFLSASQKAFWQGMLQRIPPLETMQIEGKTLLNAYKNGRLYVGERAFAHEIKLPELYPIYPEGSLV
jgi:hypothetical protein